MHHRHLTPHRGNGHYLGMHITEPHQAVALYPIPHIILHIEFYRIGAGFPNVVQTAVGAFETPHFGVVAQKRPGLDIAQIERLIGIKQVDASEAESAFAAFHTAEPGYIHNEIAQRMLISGILRVIIDVDTAHCLGNRFAQAHTKAFRRFRLRHPAIKLQATVYFLAEIKKQRGCAPRPGTKPGTVGGIVYTYLPGKRLQQRLGITYIGAGGIRHPHNPHRCQRGLADFGMSASSQSQQHRAGKAAHQRGFKRGHGHKSRSDIDCRYFTVQV